MKRISLVIVLLTPCGVFADQAPIPACPSATLQDYINMGSIGCSIGSLQYSDFRQPFIGDVGGGNPADAAGFAASNIFVGWDSDPFILVFAFGESGVFTAGMPATEVSYKVTLLPSTDPIDSVSIQDVAGALTGGGTGEVIENVSCESNTIFPCAHLVATLCNGNGPGLCYFTTQKIPAADSILVSDEIIVDATHGTVEMSEVNAEFDSPAPEPTAVALLGTAIIGCLLSGLRQRRRQPPLPRPTRP